MCTFGMLDMAMWRGSRIIRMVKLALKAGSSKQGKAARANVASNCVEARTLWGIKQMLMKRNKGDILHNQNSSRFHARSSILKKNKTEKTFYITTDAPDANLCITKKMTNILSTERRLFVWFLFFFLASMLNLLQAIVASTSSSSSAVL